MKVPGPIIGMVNTESTHSSWSLAVSSLAIRHWPRPWMLLTLGCCSWKGRCSFHCLCHRRGHWANPVKKWRHSTQPPQCPGWPEAQGTAAAMEQSQKFSTAMARKVVESQLFNDATLEFPSRGLESCFCRCQTRLVSLFCWQNVQKMDARVEKPSIHSSTPAVILKNEIIHYKTVSGNVTYSPWTPSAHTLPGT